MWAKGGLQPGLCDFTGGPPRLQPWPPRLCLSRGPQELLLGAGAPGVRWRLASCVSSGCGQCSGLLVDPSTSLPCSPEVTSGSR